MSTTHYLRAFSETKHFQHLSTTFNPKPTITKFEALKLVEGINIASTKVFKNVALLVERKGYIALGFNKSSECLKKRLIGFSASYVSRLITAVETYLKLDPKLIYLNLVSESTFRPLQSLSDIDCHNVWSYALEHKSNPKRLTSRDIKKAIFALDVKYVQSKSTCQKNKIISKEINPIIHRYAERISASLHNFNIETKEEYMHLARMVYLEVLERWTINDKEAA